MRDIMNRIREGMIVRSADGEEIGKVVVRGTDHFEVEKGTVFHKEFVATEDDVREIRGGEVILDRCRDELLAEGPRETFAQPLGEKASAPCAGEPTKPAAGPGEVGPRSSAR